MDDGNVFNYQLDNFSQAFHVMEELWRDQVLCDVTLKVEDKRISAHRIVLSGMIPYFRAMFSHNMKENTQECVEIQGVDYEALEIFFNYAYTGRVAISASNSQKLMIAASFLQLTSVHSACITFLQNRFTPMNVIGLRMFADSLSCTALMDAAEKYIDEHFESISIHEEFLSLPFSEVSKLIQKNNLHVSSEQKVFEAVMRWVKQDEYERKDCLPNLLNFTRLPLLSIRYLVDNVSSEPLIRSSHECRDLVDEAHTCHSMPERRQLLPSFKTHPRRCTSIVGHIFVLGLKLGSGTSHSVVEVFNPAIKTWKMDEAMEMSRSKVGFAVMNNKLYAVGGSCDRESFSTVEVFESLTRSWKKLASMHCKRSDAQVVALNERLYVCGGSGGWMSSLNTVECYNPNINEWTIVSSLKIRRSLGRVVAFEDHIYVLGGWDTSSSSSCALNTVERFDPSTGARRYVTPMLSKRYGFGVASLEGKLYVCGGCDDDEQLSTVEMFNPVTENWKYVAPMNVKRHGAAVVANMGKLWAIEGFDGVSLLQSVEIYDPDTNSWTFAESMCTHKGSVEAVVIQP